MADITLTEEQKAHLETIKQKWIDHLFSTDIPLNKKDVEEAIYFFYKKANENNLKTFYYVSDPVAAQAKANELMGTKDEYYSFSYYFDIYSHYICNYYDCYVYLEIKMEDDLIEANEMLLKLIKAGIFTSIEFDEAIIIVERPDILHVDAEYNLHCPTGPAVGWSQSRKGLYYINGRELPQWPFKAIENNTLTLEQFLNEDNEEVRAAIYEIMEATNGEGAMLRFLGATVVDSSQVVHADGSIETIELYKTELEFEGEEDFHGNSPSKLTWLKMTCPSTGTNYLLPSDASFNTALDAAKYHRPSGVDDKLDYKWNQRS